MNEKLIALKDRLIQQVTAYYLCNEPAIEQIVHTQSVAAYTRLIALGEEQDKDQCTLLETAAWLHDIGCPNARRIYGNSLPAHQESEGAKLTADWLKDETSLTDEQKEWLIQVVGSHHQFSSAKKFQFEPLFEADLIVNLTEGYYERSKARHLYETMMTTQTGRKLYEALFLKTDR